MRIFGFGEDKSVLLAQEQISRLANCKDDASRQEEINLICQNIYEKTAGRLGTDEDYVHTIFDNLDAETIASIMDSYSEATGSEILLDIQNDFSGKEEEGLISQLNDSYLKARKSQYTGDDDGRLTIGQKASAVWNALKTMGGNILNAGVSYVKNIVKTEIVDKAKAKIENCARIVGTHLKDFVLSGGTIIVSNLSKMAMEVSGKIISGLLSGSVDWDEIKEISSRYYDNAVNEITEKAKTSYTAAKEEIMEDELIAAIATSSSKEEALSRLEAMGCDYAQELVQRYIQEPIEDSLAVINDQKDALIQTAQAAQNGFRFIIDAMEAATNVEYKQELLQSILLLGQSAGNLSNTLSNLGALTQMTEIVNNKTQSEETKAARLKNLNASIKETIAQGKEEKSQAASKENENPKTDNEAYEQYMQRIMDRANSGFGWLSSKAQLKKSDRGQIQELIGMDTLKELGFSYFTVESYEALENGNQVIVIKNRNSKAQIVIKGNAATITVDEEETEEQAA